MKTIKELRTERGLTQMQLAVAIGVTTATVYNWERGTFEPKASQLRAIARYFHVSMDDIVFEADEVKIAA